MRRSLAARAARRSRPVFAALGDERRLRIVERLCDEGPLSATRLAEDAGVSRQAITKHLRVLAAADLVAGTRSGRESRWRLDPGGLAAARRFLDVVSREWDARIERLRGLVESPAPGPTPRGPAAGAAARR